MSDITLAIAIGITSLVTLATRALPFIIFSNGKKTPEFITYLGNKLPYAVMAMLVVYCLRGMSFSSASGFVPEIIASAITIGSYIWKKNTLLSIILGTVVYMVLVQFVFVAPTV